MLKTWARFRLYILAFTRFCSLSVRACAVIFKGQLWLSLFFWAWRRNVFIIRIQDGDKIMPLGFLYVQVRLLSFFRKCSISVQIK